MDTKPEYLGIRQSFTQLVTPEQWSRFHLLAPRVRRAELHGYLHSSLVAELYFTNPKRSPLLPSVLSLDLDVDASGYNLLFMRPILRTLKLRIPNLRDEDLHTKTRLSI